MNVFKCSFCAALGYSENGYPPVCDCNRGIWDVAELETIANPFPAWI